MNVKKIFDFSNRVVVITGAAGLLGTEYANGFSQAGANVVLADKNFIKCKKLAIELEKKFGVKPLAVNLDVTNPKSIKKMVEQVMKKFSKIKGYNCVMTSKKHTRCLDRVFEATKKLHKKPSNNDLVVCVQGDEPMLHPKMIEAVVSPLIRSKKISGTVLAMKIIHSSQFFNPDIVKIVHDIKGQILYTSRSPIPYCKKFSKRLNAKRIGGILAFKYFFLKEYFKLKPSPLEITESCDTNRICDNGGGMYIAPIKYSPYFSVDSPSDLKLVNRAISKDTLWKNKTEICPMMR